MDSFLPRPQFATALTVYHSKYVISSLFSADFEDHQVEDYEVERSEAKGCVAHGRALGRKSHEYEHWSSEQDTETGSDYEIAGCRA